MDLESPRNNSGISCLIPQRSWSPMSGEHKGNARKRTYHLCLGFPSPLFSGAGADTSAILNGIFRDRSTIKVEGRLKEEADMANLTASALCKLGPNPCLLPYINIILANFGLA
jgi:hypothetical protein